ncbi:MAG: hypothetical protein IJ660_05600 [Alphaproteobacteria bacterium]|nr:hypothetical protein [Alphaproteobacteria bacterium]
MNISIDEIKENLAFAAGIMRRLPAVRVQGYNCSWPKFCMDEDDLRNEGDIWLMPLPEEITIMENILSWLEFTSFENRRIIWLRSCGMGWKRIADRTHRSRSGLIRIYNNGLKDICETLNLPTNEKKTTLTVHSIRLRV